MRVSKKVKSFSDISLPRGVLDGTTPLSQTLVMAFCQCPKQFIYMLDRWERPGQEINTFFGTIVHEVLEKCTGHTLGEIQESLPGLVTSVIKEKHDKRELEWLSPSDRAYQEGIILTVLQEYYAYYGDELEHNVIMCEKKFDIQWPELGKIMLTGKIDRVERDHKGLVCIDHKTAGEISEDEKLMALPLNFQLKFYSHAVHELTGELPYKYMHNMIRRPKHRPKNGEKLVAFLKRLREEIQQKPEHFFMRFESTFSEEEYEEFKSNLGNKLNRIYRTCDGGSKVFPNEAFCVGVYKCPYLEACATNSLANYRQRKYISPELI